MENTIKIRKLEVFAFHGVNEAEKIQGQRFYINATLFLDYQDTMLSDDISKTIHYGHVSKDIIKFFSDNRFDLIETITHKLAIFLFEKYQLLTKIEIEVEKPWAPMKFSFKSVSTKIIESKQKVYIALGGNIGSSEKYFQEAINQISNIEGVYSIRKSPMYSSKPFGDVKQSDFLNMAIEVSTSLHPHILLEKLQEIETKCERVRDVHWGPRTLDLDIILYGNEIISCENLLIPHLYMSKRDFVLKPLLDLNPYLIDPMTNIPLIRYYEQLENVYIKEI